MKKRVVLLLIISLCFLSANAQQKKNSRKFTLNGKVIGRDTGLIWLSYIDKNRKEIDDSTYLKKGNFSFTGYIDEPSLAYIGGIKRSTKTNEDGSNIKYLYIEPVPMQITFRENDFKHAKIIGSKTQSEKDTIAEYPSEKNLATFDIGFDKALKAIRQGDTSTVLKNKFKALLKTRLIYKQQVKETVYAFIASHPKSYLSPDLMDYYFRSEQLSLDSAKLFYNSFDPLVKQSTKGKYLGSLIMAKSSSSIGNEAFTFIKTDINGKEINLATYKGKSYVLLDFWASWCVPCRELTPYLKSIYAKYNLKGLDIISISEDTDQKAWKKAVLKDNMIKWHNIIDKDGIIPSQYFVTPIPTCILIDKDGNIAGRYFGDEAEDKNELDKKLKSLFL